MIRTLIALSGLVGMVGLVAVVEGCSDSDPQTSSSATEPAQDAGTPKPPRAPTTPDPADDDTDGEESTPPAMTCMDTAPFDATTVPYKSPAVQAGACTAADVKVFDDYITDHPQATFDDVKAALAKQSQRCSECAFGDPDDETWAPIVADESSAIVNGGGCVAVVSKKDACGKAYQQWNTCLNVVCKGCSDQTENGMCKNDAQQPGAPCGDASKGLLDACGRNVNDYLKACFGSGFGGVITQLCGSPSRDGGV